MPPPAWPALPFNRLERDFKARLREPKTPPDKHAEAKPDGINNTGHNVTLSYGLLTTAQARTLENFILAQKGTAIFTFVLPGEASARRWRYLSYRGPGWVSATRRSMTCILTEADD